MGFGNYSLRPDFLTLALLRGLRAVLSQRSSALVLHAILLGFIQFS